MIEHEQRKEILRQIGGMNVLAISGGRVKATENGVELVCGYGYRVTVDLDPSDTYTVRRVLDRGAKRFVKGEVSGVYCDQVGEQAYRAGMFRDDWAEGQAVGRLGA